MPPPHDLPDEIEICPHCHAGILFRQFHGPKGCYCSHCGARCDSGVVFTRVQPPSAPDPDDMPPLF